MDSEAVGGATYKWTTLLGSDEQAGKAKVLMSSLASCSESSHSVHVAYRISLFVRFHIDCACENTRF